MKTVVEIRSADEASVLKIEVLERYSADDYRFAAYVSNGCFSGTITAGTFLCGPPSRLFDDLDQSYQGWKGSRIWHSTGHELTLTATSGSRGSVQMKVEMHQLMLDTRLCVTFDIEGGTLQRTACDMRAAFGS